MEIQIGPVHLKKLKIIKSAIINDCILAEIETVVAVGHDNCYSKENNTTFLHRGLLTLNEQEIDIIHNAIHR